MLKWHSRFEEEIRSRPSKSIAIESFNLIGLWLDLSIFNFQKNQTNKQIITIVASLFAIVALAFFQLVCCYVPGSMAQCEMFTLSIITLFIVYLIGSNCVGSISRFFSALIELNWFFINWLRPTLLNRADLIRLTAI